MLARAYGSPKAQREHRRDVSAHAGQRQAAAEALGIDRSTLYEKVKRYDIAR